MKLPFLSRIGGRMSMPPEKQLLINDLFKSRHTYVLNRKA